MALDVLISPPTEVRYLEDGGDRSSSITFAQGTGTRKRGEDPLFHSGDKGNNREELWGWLCRPPTKDK